MNDSDSTIALFYRKNFLLFLKVCTLTQTTAYAQQGRNIIGWFTYCPVLFISIGSAGNWDVFRIDFIR